MEIPLRLQGAGFLSVGILDLNKWKIYRRAAPRPALFSWADPTFKKKHSRSRIRSTFCYTQTAASRPSKFRALFGFSEVRFSEKNIFFKGKSRKNAIFSKKTRKNDHFFPSSSLRGFPLRAKVDFSRFFEKITVYCPCKKKTWLFGQL